MKKVFSKNSLTISALGEGVKPTGSGEWVYTSTAANDAAVLASLGGISTAEEQSDDGWPVMGGLATDAQIDALIAANAVSSAKPF